jgi:hypothetical protein
MKQYRNGAAIAMSAASAACVMGALAGPASAAAQTFKDHASFNPTGDVFTCQGGDLTITGGTVSQSVEGVLDGQGVSHITGTIVPHNVTMTDGANTYTLSGAQWFGGKAVDPDGNLLIVSTDTEHFVIRDASGGLYAKVQIVEHLSPNGTSFTFDRGACEAPQG